MQLLSEYCMEKVISLGPDKLIVKKAPWDRNAETLDIKIEPELFFWRLYHGKKYIQCESEEEAEFMKIFMEARQSRIAIPKDPEYLKKILPELKELKKKHDDVIEDTIDTLFSKKLRERALAKIWMGVFADEYFDWEAFYAIEEIGEL